MPQERSAEAPLDDAKPLLLLVEDNRADVYLVRRALDHHGVQVSLLVLEDGEEALKYIERADSDDSTPAPAMVLLDLNLPRKSGADVLARVRTSDRCRSTPVIVLTSSDSQDDRRRAAELGADLYFRKPSSYLDFLDIGKIVKTFVERGYR